MRPEPYRHEADESLRPGILGRHHHAMAGLRHNLMQRTVRHEGVYRVMTRCRVVGDRAGDGTTLNNLGSQASALG